jgi:RNA polymerase sigma factor (sigma-70 family)
MPARPAAMGRERMEPEARTMRDGPKDKGGAVRLLTPRQHALLEQKMHLVEKRVAYWARRFEGLEEREDFLTAGKIGLLEAIHKADPNRQAELDGYAIANIDGRILDLVRCASRIRKMERAVRQAGAELLGTVRIEYDTLRDSGEMLKDLLVDFAGGLTVAGYIAGVTAGGAADPEAMMAKHEEDAEGKCALDELMAALSEDQRVVVQLVVGEQMKMTKVQEQLGISYNTVRRRLERGLKRLQAEVETREEGEAKRRKR